MNDKDREEFIEMKFKVDSIEKKTNLTHSIVKEMSDTHKKLSFHLFGDLDTETKGWIYKLGRFDSRLTFMEKVISIFLFLCSSTVVYFGFIKNVFGFFS